MTAIDPRLSVGVHGLWHLGTVVAACAASAGHQVVGFDEDVARVGGEGASDLAAERRPDRDVLQVRIAAAQAARRRHRLIERRVNAPRRRVDE